MRRLIILVISTYAWTLMADWSSGGGDYLPAFFSEGRAIAASQLRNFQGTFEGGALDSRSRARNFFEKRRDDLADDVELSPHSWVQMHDDAFFSCAVTEFGRYGAAVRLSYETCRFVSAPQYAAFVLIHESVHHLDASLTEAEADSIAWVAVFQHHVGGAYIVDAFLSAFISLPFSYMMFPFLGRFFAPTLQ